MGSVGQVTFYNTTKKYIFTPMHYSSAYAVHIVNYMHTICEPVYMLVTYTPGQMLYLRQFAYVSHTVIECASYVLHL